MKQTRASAYRVRISASIRDLAYVKVGPDGLLGLYLRGVLERKRRAPIESREASACAAVDYSA
jgi:hypothetical protein